MSGHLHAVIIGNRVECLGAVAVALRYPVHTLCCMLARTDLPDCSVAVSFGGRDELLIESFRDSAAFAPDRRWRRVRAAGSGPETEPAASCKLAAGRLANTGHTTISRIEAAFPTVR